MVILKFQHLQIVEHCHDSVAPAGVAGYDVGTAGHHSTDPWRNLVNSMPNKSTTWTELGTPKLHRKKMWYLQHPGELEIPNKTSPLVAFHWRLRFAPHQNTTSSGRCERDASWDIHRLESPTAILAEKPTVFSWWPIWFRSTTSFQVMILNHTTTVYNLDQFRLAYRDSAQQW